LAKIRVWSLLFASLLWSSGQSPTATAATDVDDRARGEALAATCSGCHASSNRAIPSLGDRKASELYAILVAYKKDEINGTVMNRLVKGYSDNDLNLIANALGD
jgi:cytochrome c553